MNVRQFHGGMVDSVVLDGNDCGFPAVNRERHVESIAVPVVENAEKPIRGYHGRYEASTIPIHA